MAYTKTVWEDLPSTNTPINATNLNNIENGIKTNETNITALNSYSTNSYASNGISFRFEKIGRMVIVTLEGTTTSALTADVNYSVTISSDYTPTGPVRNSLLFNEAGVIAYIYVDGTTLQYRTKSNVSSPAYPRVSFTYIARN